MAFVVNSMARSYAAQRRRVRCGPADRREGRGTAGGHEHFRVDRLERGEAGVGADARRSRSPGSARRRCSVDALQLVVQRHDLRPVGGVGRSPASACTAAIAPPGTGTARAVATQTGTHERVTLADRCAVPHVRSCSAQAHHRAVGRRPRPAGVRRSAASAPAGRRLRARRASARPARGRDGSPRQTGRYVRVRRPTSPCGLP